MQRPEPRSTNNDTPRKPSTFWSAGMTTSRTCAIPASMDDGCASIVVERAYARPPLFARKRQRKRQRFHQPPSSGGLPMAMGSAAALVRHWQARHWQRSTGRHPIVRVGRSTPFQSIRPARVPADGRAGGRTRRRRAPRRPLPISSCFSRRLLARGCVSIASRLSKDVQVAACPDARSTSRLALQNPSSASRSGSTDAL